MKNIAFRLTVIQANNNIAHNSISPLKQNFDINLKWASRMFFKKCFKFFNLIKI